MMMKRMYEVTYKTYVVADNHEEAEQIARDINLTIQDNSIEADLISPILEPKILNAAEKLIYNLFQIPGIDSNKAQEILRVSLNDLKRRLSNEELEALYAHCERVYLYNNEE